MEDTFNEPLFYLLWRDVSISDSVEGSTIIYSQCPFCKCSEIQITWHENGIVTDCQGRAIDPTITSICERCRDSIVESPLHLQICNFFSKTMKLAASIDDTHQVARIIKRNNWFKAAGKLHKYKATWQSLFWLSGKRETVSLPGLERCVFGLEQHVVGYDGVALLYALFACKTDHPVFYLGASGLLNIKDGRAWVVVAPVVEGD